MAEYLRPDVYVEELNDGAKPIQSVSTSVGSFVGIAPRGTTNKAVLCSSWTDYVRKFAEGLDTPFMRDSHLSDAVYGFFQNGGSNCYIVRPKTEGMKKAVAQEVMGRTRTTKEGVDPKSSPLVITAKDEGAWANDMKLEVKANGELFDLIVSIKDTVVEEFEEVSNDPTSEYHYTYVVNEKSKFIHINEGQTLVVKSYTFSGGAYNNSGVSDKELVDGLQALNPVEVNMVAIPGKTSDTVHTGLLNYADGRKDCFAIVDLPKNLSSIEEVMSAREKLSGDLGATYFPWGKIADPFSRNGALRLCPPSGHMMGLYARTDVDRGVHKAPAGEEAKVRGFVELAYDLEPSEIDLLNPRGVNCIIAKPNVGIVSWGARTVSSDPYKRYVSDVRYDMMIKGSLYKGTQWAVFEPNGEELWERVATSIQAFLDVQWRDGALRGETAEQAYYVKCDADLNTEDTMNLGRLIAEIGYSKKKPAEFVIVRISQKSISN